MKKPFNPLQNFEDTKKAVGYVTRKEATQETYNDIGFMSGLEVHQQLKTTEKLFCHCPAGIFQKPDQYDAEVVRHMRPTLSELGEYDGTALMEFKTRKNIIYRLRNVTTCTYEVDDTPPFPLNREALQISIEIAHLSKLNIVGEVHITRKQYLDGSIPTGFQRTAIIGVEGEIPLKNKKIRLIQLSLEEDSCREVSDIGHTRIFRTDRLGMPLIETVTYPDMVNPDEVKEACDYIRFLNRSTGKVRTGMGAGRQDVNVSCRGGSRVEIKGVAHTKWIPDLTHIECFRQWALLKMRNLLRARIADGKRWKIQSEVLDYHTFRFDYEPLKLSKNNKHKIIAINLPGFKGMLSHFTQPGKMFANELSERLKVIACLEVPNLIHTEQFQQVVNAEDFDRIRTLFMADDDDAQLIIWGPEEDMATALESIEERCKMAFEGVPNETRKSFADGTTIFERVLPGADRMYPDTDSAPIPLKNSYIEELSHNVPDEVIGRYNKMKAWGIPEDTYTYIFKKNLYPHILHVVEELQVNPVFAGVLFGHTLKFVEGHFIPSAEFNFRIIQALFKYLNEQGLEHDLARKMLPVLYQYPKMDFESVLTSIKFKRITHQEIYAHIPFLKKKFAEISTTGTATQQADWIMGQLRKMAIGNVRLKVLAEKIKK